MYRVQFTITDEERKQMEIKAKEGNFPTLAEYAKTAALYAKTAALQGQNSYVDLYQEAVKKIDGMDKGTEFYVRDLIPNPPALIGRWIFEGVKFEGVNNEDHKIKNVKSLGRTGIEPEKYEKL